MQSRVKNAPVAVALRNLKRYRQFLTPPPKKNKNRICPDFKPNNMDEHPHLNFYMYALPPPGKGLGPAFPLEKVHLKMCSYLQRSFLHLMPSPFSSDVEDLSSRNELEKSVMCLLLSRQKPLPQFFVTRN